jgi:hypothetical protein
MRATFAAATLQHQAQKNPACRFFDLRQSTIDVTIAALRDALTGMTSRQRAVPQPWGNGSAASLPGERGGRVVGRQATGPSYAQLAACMSSARACLPFRTLLRGVRCDALRQPRPAALVAQLAPIIGRPASVCRIPACQRRRAHGRLPLPSAAEQHHLSGGREPFCTRFHQTFDGTSGGGDQAFLNTVVRASLTHAITGLEILR